MIGRLRGRVVERAPGRVLLDVGGVGYELQVSFGTFADLGAADGTEVTLHVHTHVREDSLQLFGFVEPAERMLFEMLIAISGVGPRLALSILSGIGDADLRRAVREQDRARLQRIPGIGRKTAERLLLELRDRLADGSEAAADGGAAGAVSTAGQPETVRGDAVSALINLGYAEDAASRAVTRAAAEGDGSLETLLRAALRRI